MVPLCGGSRGRLFSNAPEVIVHGAGELALASKSAVAVDVDSDVNRHRGPPSRARMSSRKRKSHRAEQGRGPGLPPGPHRVRSVAYAPSWNPAAQPTITAPQPQATAQISHAIEYLGGAGSDRDGEGFVTHVR